MTETIRRFPVATIVATVTFTAGLKLLRGDYGDFALNQETTILAMKSAFQAFFCSHAGTRSFYCTSSLQFYLILAEISILFSVSPHPSAQGNIEKMRSQFDRLAHGRCGRCGAVQGQVNATTINCEITREDDRERLTSMDQKEEANTVLEHKEIFEKECQNLKSPLSADVVKKTRDPIHEREYNKTAQTPPPSDIVRIPPAELCRHFTFAEIQVATHNFDNAFLIGKGGFGKVYQGSIDDGAATVAIKRLDPLSKQGNKEFWTEIDMLSKFRHSHLVSLIGYCNVRDEMILVYEYMSKGSIADHLHAKNGRNVNTCNICWVQRLKICIGAARGLDYLHTGIGFLQRVIHRDVKSSNILLDENWVAKISDFGLSKIGPANQSCTHVSTCVKGTRGYIDPDYVLTHRLTRKSDVYAFGVVLFEMLCGRPALDLRLPEEQRGLVVWAQHCIQEDKAHNLIDPNLKWEIFPNSLKEFVKIANQCLNSSPKKRPTMSEVVASLESALALQERKDSSILGDYDFDFGGTYDDQEKAGISSAQKEVIVAGPGSFKPEDIVMTEDVDTLAACECMPKYDQGHQGHGGSGVVDEKADLGGDEASDSS